jgi:hypothetical protein
MVMALIRVFSRCPAAQSAVEMRFDNLFSVDILPVVECMWPSNVTSLSLGTHWKRGLFTGDTSSSRLLFGYSLTLESEKYAKIANWKVCQLVACPQCCRNLSCAVRGFASWQSQQRRLGSPYAPPTSHGRDWSPVSSKKKPWLLLSDFVSTTEPHCSRGVQPGGICAYVVHREPTPRGPGSSWRRGRRRFNLLSPAVASRTPPSSSETFYAASAAVFADECRTPVVVLSVACCLDRLSFSLLVV